MKTITAYKFVCPKCKKDCFISDDSFYDYTYTDNILGCKHFKQHLCQ